jgi:GTPase SAR1 family protein
VATIETDLLAELNAIRKALGAADKVRATPRYAIIDRAFTRIERSLTRPLRIGVLGEENSGKSLLINYLLKHQILPSGGFAGGSTAILVRHAPEPSVHAIRPDGIRNRLTSKAFGRLIKPETRRTVSTPSVIYDGLQSRESPARPAPERGNLVFAAPKKADALSRLIEVGLPLEVLKQVEMIELRALPEAQPASPVTRAFRSVDLTIWCTLATQAWKETEVLAWKRVPSVYRRGSLMLVTYKDAIRHEKDEAKITARLRHATTALFGDVALISLRDAVQSLIAADAQEAGRLRVESNVEHVERAILAMIHNWQIRRLQKVGRLLHLIAAKLSRSGQGRNVVPNRELAFRLQRLALAFLRASPSISFTGRAA